MIRVPYVKVELVYRYHKPERFHAMIDTGSDVTMVSANAYPERYWKNLRKPLQVDVASGQIIKLTKAVFGQFIAIHDTPTGSDKILPLPTVVIQTPKDATYNILLGVDFLKRFKEYCSNHSQIRFLTPCGHWITSNILYNSTLCTHISFAPRSQHGGYPSKKDIKYRRNLPKNPSALIQALHTTQKAL